MPAPITPEIERALELKREGKFDEAIALLISIVDETGDLASRVVSASEVVTCVLEKTDEGLPSYGTPEYYDVAKYLRIAVTSYKQLSPAEKKSIDVEPSVGLLKLISKADPNIQRIEQAIKSLEGEFKSGRVTVARRGKWADDFLSRFPHQKIHSFSNDDPNVIATARQIAAKKGILILMNTDGHENEILSDPRYR
jgi:hypothetical protein